MIFETMEKRLKWQKKAFDNFIKRRSIFFPAFEIYGGFAGLYDIGPAGCAIKAELESLWRKFFIFEENLLEMQSPCLTPYPVLKASGHVDRFNDFIVYDKDTGECFRADKLLEEYLTKRLNEMTENKHLKKLDQSLESPNSTLNQSQLYESSFNLNDIISNYPNSEQLPLIIIERILCRISGFKKDEMTILFNYFNMKNPNTKNHLTSPEDFNLMFSTHLGPKAESKTVCYLRPELAQGIIVNFKRLYEYSYGRFPFGVAQIGLGFRNEISPRNALIRLREFSMAEIEFFTDPKETYYFKFSSVEHLKLPLFSRESQNTGKGVNQTMTLREAIDKKIILNTYLAYFIGRTYLFLKKCGISDKGLRFRQHLPTEMAHYSSDCWDAEILTSIGWIECVGLANRSAYDLSCHMEKSKIPLYAYKRLEEAKVVDTYIWKMYKKVIAQRLKHRTPLVIDYLEKIDDAQKIEIEDKLNQNGSYIITLEDSIYCTITRDMVNLERSKSTIYEEKFIPEIIEPSFGLGRILYCLLEHAFTPRDIENQEERCVLALPTRIAPIKCSILPLSSNTSFDDLINDIKERLHRADVSYRVDDSSSSVGKRYARSDEIGIPYDVTVDFQSIKDKTVTLRERDSMEQIRVEVNQLVEVFAQLVNNGTKWSQIYSEYPHFVAQNI